MASPRLREGLSFCRADGVLIFLDVDNDRYFRLSEEMEDAFTAYENGNSSADITKLVRNNILVDDQHSTWRTLSWVISSPTRSALEQSASPALISSGGLIKVLAHVCVVQWQLKACRLIGTLKALAAYREWKAPKPVGAVCAEHEQQLLAAAATFSRSRLRVPIETCCLLDSLALLRFLAANGLHANAVFGVSAAPFSAHCWVQTGDIVLNDSVGNVDAHTPIRVV